MGMIILIMNFTPNHLVKPSPWPLYISFGVFLLALSFTSWMHNYMNSGYILFFAFLFVVAIFAVWSRDIVREFLYLGVHTLTSKQGINSSMHYISKYQYGSIIFILMGMWFICSILFFYRVNAESKNAKQKCRVKVQE